MATIPTNFTQAGVNRLPAPPSKPDGKSDSVWYSDDNAKSTPKLRLRVSSTGARNWYYYSKVEGIPRRIPIGEFPTVNVDAARKAAAKYGGQIAIGRDPHIERKETRTENQRKSLTVADALSLHLANKAHKHSDRTKKEYDKVFKSTTAGLQKWLHKPVTGITERMVEAWFRGRLQRSPAGAAVEARYLRAILNTANAEQPGIIPNNPCGIISRKELWPELKPRKGYIKPKQMPAFFSALVNLPTNVQNAQYADAKDYLRFLLFSGSRTEETALLKPSDIIIEERLFILRDPKNRQKNTELPLNDELLKLVERRLNLDTEYMFADASGVQPMQTPRKAITAIRKLSGVEFTPHDLRRTFRTVAAKISLPMNTGALLVNHKIGGTLAVDLAYIQVEPEELLAASNQVADEILRQANR